MVKEQEKNSNRKQNRVWIIGALVILLLAGILIGILVGKKNGEQEMDNSVPEETVPETESAAEEEAEAAYVNAPLELNMYPEVNSLIEQYYKAAADGDTDTILQLRNKCEQTELLQIQEKSKYLEEYQDINCYTKPGPVEDSHVVYVSYYAKFFDVEQPVCGLNTYVVCRNDLGNYYIHDSESDEAMKLYRTEVTQQDDVVELFNRVQVEYNETVAGNTELAAFLNELSDKLKAAVGDALAEAEAQAEAALKAEQGIVEEEITEPVSYIVTANDVVNIRKSDSQGSESLGKARVGEEFTLLENKANGWSCVEYNGGVAFIKSEFLDGEAMDLGVSATAGRQDENTENVAESEPEENAGEETNHSNVPASGEFRVSDSVNVRKSPSQSADRIGVAHTGTVITIIEKQSDGWTKVKFNGSTGYIKTEVLE